MSRAAAAFLSACAVALAACTGSGELRSPERALPCPECSVILISLDTLRADHLDLYGYSRQTAPRLSERAAQAVVFEASFSVGSGTWNALRTPDWKLIQGRGETLLYHLGSGPGEHTERLLERMARAADEEMFLSSRLARPGMEGDFVELDDEEVRRVKALGWLD